MKGLSPKHARFVAEVLIDLNPTRAYKVVYGVGQRVAEVAGPRLIRNVAAVAIAVAEGKQRQVAGSELSAARILEELRRCALEDRTRILDCKTVADLRALPDELRAIVQDFEVFEANIAGVRDGKTDRVRRVRTVPKTQAIEMLAKHFKLLTEVSELQASDELLARLDRGRERNAARGRKK
jgi:hypothetical protein